MEKKYSTEIVLRNLKIVINGPGIYGVIGGNGQGKTTLFRCALGLESYSGESMLNGEKVSLQNTAFCPAEPLVYDELTSKEFHEFYCNLLGHEFSERFELFDLPKSKLIKTFSTGMKKKVYLNAIFQKRFPMYFLDEPFNGLDIESNYRLIAYLKELSKDSIIVISSHIIDILYNNCNNIYLIKDKGIKAYSFEEFQDLETDFFSTNVS